MQFTEFDNMEDMHAAMRAAEEAANTRLTAAQIDLRDDTQQTRYWARVVPEYDLVVFGKAFSEEEAYQSEVRAGATPEQAAQSRNGIRESRQRGYLFGIAFSTVEPDGELGDTHVFNVVPISRDTFDRARWLGWSLSPSEEGRKLANELIEASVANGCPPGGAS